jgi:hypothetical protein
MSRFKELVTSLETKIQNTFETGVTVEEAEKLAAEFLYAQLKVSENMAKADLDRRMRKTGVKAIRANVYLEAVSRQEKKPSDSYLDNIINLHEIVQSEQEELDKAEVEFAELERLYDTFLNAHIYFRNIGKGSYG